MKDLLRIIRSLRDHERGIRPDPTWVRATRATLTMQVKNTMPSAEVAARHRSSLIVTLYREMVQAIRGPVLATMSVVSVVLGGSIASVSAAEQALPGDTLYSIKLVTEQARLALTGTSHDKLKLKSAFTIRRVEELRAIITTDAPEKDERASLAADVLKRDLDTLKQQLTDVQEDSEDIEVADAARTVDKNAVEVVKALAETTNNLSPDVKEKVAAAQAQAADVGIKALEVLVDVRQGAGDTAVSSLDISSSLAAHAEVAADTVAATKVLAGINASSSAALLPSQSTSSTTLQLTKDAEASLAAAEQLAGSENEEHLDEAVTLLKDATTKSFIAQKQVVQETLALSNSSSSAAMLDGASTSSTTNLTNTSSTPSGVSTASSTPMTTSTTQ